MPLEELRVEGLTGYRAYKYDSLSGLTYPLLLVSRSGAHYYLERIGLGSALLKAVHVPTGRVTQISGHSLLTDAGGVVKPFKA